MSTDWTEINERRIGEKTQELLLYCSQKKEDMTSLSFDLARLSLRHLLDNLAERDPYHKGIPDTVKDSMEKQDIVVAQCSEKQAACLARTIVYKAIGDDLNLYPVTAEKKLQVAKLQGIPCSIRREEMVMKDMLFIANAIAKGEDISKGTMKIVFEAFKEFGFDPMMTRVYSILYFNPKPMLLASLPMQSVLGRDYKKTADKLVSMSILTVDANGNYSVASNIVDNGSLSPVSHIKEKVTVEKLKEYLSPSWLFDGKASLDNKFKTLAEILISQFWIRKGDHHYWMNDIEFYLFSDIHKDIITYPRNCNAGSWCLHPSGVDICFKSNIKKDKSPKNNRWLPRLTPDSFFGGILVRGIEPVEPLAIPKGAIIVFDGPWKSCDELFDVFDAFAPDKAFPLLEPSNTIRVLGDLKVCKREGFTDDVKKKVASIKTYYSDMYLLDSELEAAYTDYKEKKYHFIKQ